MNPKIVFMGTPEFGIKPLGRLVEAGYQIIGVITAPDKPAGRKQILTPPPVKVLAEKHGLPVYQPKDKDELFEILKKLRPDIAVVAAFGMIFTKEMLTIPKYGFLNIHASLLPRWRGASPIQSVILSGEEKTGATIMLINEKMDQGPILKISNLKSLPADATHQALQAGQISNVTYKKLENELSELGGKLLIKTIPKWIKGEINPREQDHGKATYCKKITKEDGLIDLNNEPPEIIERKIRAFTPWPGAYIFINGKRLIITEAELKNNSLKIKAVKPENKNEMDFADYLRGNLNKDLEKYL
ncbi:MAG: methionyl-tRNA formyltransferase [Candidatus Tagabacteria bacterium RIFCSPLOWO2_01_FULL_42_9]|uniref:Methionyl-tRNA formyltransferase n=1 Tax=Candidatus Tagabacteria bacterium RIFCSPLOWO2_01_FULL_42_9 TaxID=1802296 RepID=A0A1G2LV10_9BACT|nr:MAG: methionyl-tRNA formyltransferase [Candidatus Tagabacteria bacterium RIFCSPLOWO2_01_FULL_42_9]